MSTLKRRVVKKAAGELKYLHDADPWMLGEDIPDMDLFFSQIWLSCFTNEFSKPAGKRYKKTLTLFTGYHMWFYFGEKDSYEVGEHIVKKFLADPAFATTVNKQIIIEADKLRAFAKTLPTDASHLSNKQLWQYYRRHDAIHTEYYRWCWIPVAVDMFHNNLTEKLKQYLRSINVSEKYVNEYLMFLTQPTHKSLIQQEQEEFLRLAALVSKDKKQRALFKKYAAKEESGQLRDAMSPALLKKFRAFHQKYFYVKFMWIGKEGVTQLEDYLHDMAELIMSGVNPLQTLRKQEREFKAILRKRAALIKKLKINKTWRTIVTAWGDFMVTKIYRRYAQIYAVYRMQPVLLAIAQRLGVSLEAVRLMTKAEVKAALIDGSYDRAYLERKTKFFIYYTEPAVERIVTGAPARALAKQLWPAKLGEINEINGQIGCAGQAAGTVKLVITLQDMDKMEKGDILVSIATNPDIVSAMKKAAAIVTDQGGITSHAAIVARELGIPCVIGTKIATQVLKDGDRVEVDATTGIVKKV